MNNDILEMSVSLVTAHLTQNRMTAEEVPAFLRSIHNTLTELQGKPAAATASTVAAPAAAVPARVVEVPEQAVAPVAPISVPAAEEADRIPSHKIAYVRDNDLNDPAFAGLDPWLASRISPMIARKLDAKNDIHPSVYPDKLICLEDGAPVTLLRAYINNRFKLSPTEYREKWNLPDDYPMAPPAYVETKRKAAVKGGLGKSVRATRGKGNATKSASKTTVAAPANAQATPVVEAPRKRGRPRKNPEAATPVAAAAKGARTRRKLSLFPSEA